jgi:PAS domain S-box-containing protein
MQDTLLLADDEEGIRTVLGIALADSGFEVLTAENGLEAFAVFQEAHPAIVLTDIKMPGIDGIELLRRIKAEQPDTEVIMITGHGDMDLAIESLKLEATDFVTKPINDDALAIALKRAKERISMRRQLREYTDNLERLVEAQSARLVEVERLAAVGQAIEGISSAFRGMVDDLEGGVRFFNEMPCLVCIHDCGLNIVAVNPLGRERLGDLVGRRSWEIYPDKDNRSLACPVARTIESGRGQRSQEIICYHDGSRYPVTVHTAPIRNSRGDVELVLEFALDLSEVERLREDLRAAQDRLSALGLMVSSVSHGVKGILTGMDAGIYLAESGIRRGDPEQAREGVGTVKEMVERIRRVVLDVLYFAKERPVESRSTGIQDFVAHLISMAAPKTGRHAIELVAETAADSGEFEVDESALASALFNILENSVDACLENGSGTGHRILLRAASENDHVVFEISDDGVGIAAKDCDRIFDLFYSTKGKAGTGLGLFVARQVILQHGGTIAVDSAPGRGSLFRVRLPRRHPGFKPRASS